MEEDPTLGLPLRGSDVPGRGHPYGSGSPTDGYRSYTRKVSTDWTRVDPNPLGTGDCRTRYGVVDSTVVCLGKDVVLNPELT